jgi:hypothetical protein
MFSLSARASPPCYDPSIARVNPSIRLSVGRTWPGHLRSVLPPGNGRVPAPCLHVLQTASRRTGADARGKLRFGLFRQSMPHNAGADGIEIRLRQGWRTVIEWSAVEGDRDGGGAARFIASRPRREPARRRKRLGRGRGRSTRPGAAAGRSRRITVPVIPPPRQRRLRSTTAMPATVLLYRSSSRTATKAKPRSPFRPCSVIRAANRETGTRNATGAWERGRARCRPA